MSADSPRTRRVDPIDRAGSEGPAEGVAADSPQDFQAEMRALRRLMTAMASRCREQLHRALRSFWNGSKDTMADVEACNRVVEREEKAIEALALKIIALRQPAASDRRLLIASLNLVVDLKKVGDETVDLARTSVSSAADAESARRRLLRMAQEAEALFATAVEAFLVGDAAGAAEVYRTDSAVRGMYEDLFHDAVALTAHHPTDAGAALGFVAAGKCLERIADHAARIARWTAFAVGAEDVSS